MLKIKL